MKKSPPRQSERRRRLLRIFYPSEYFEDKNDEIVDDDVYGWIFRNDDDDDDDDDGDDDDKNDDEIWNCVLSEIGEIKRAKRIGKFCFGVLTFQEEFDDVLFVSVSREAIDAVVTTNCSTSNNIKKQNKKGLDSILEALSFSSCAFYERQQQQQQQQQQQNSSSSSSSSSSSKSSSSNATTISMTFVTKFLQKMLDEYECVPYFYTQKTQNWKGGRLRRKPISRVSTTLRLLATRLKAMQQKGFTTRWVWWFFCDVFLARIFFARIASRVQMVSSGFINGDYLIRNADWLAKGNPLGVKLHVPLARTLSGLAKVLAEGYASILGVRKLDTIVVRIIGERLWILGLTTQLACLSDCLFIFTSHAAALHVYSSLLVHFQITFGKFCYEAGFGANKGRQKKRQSTESLVFGVLFVPPIFLFFPTTFAYFASYLVLHAVALLVRAFLVSFVVYSTTTFDDFDDDFLYEKILLKNNNTNSSVISLSIKKKKTTTTRRRRSIDIINNVITKDFVNALRSFGRLPVALSTTTT